jgi:hypothetical protein
MCFGVDHVATVVPPLVDARRAFTTTGAFLPGGGLAAADALCQSEATSSSLPGTYHALLATTTASAISRFDTSAGAKPWARLDNVLITPTAAALVDPSLVRLDATPKHRDGSPTTLFWSGANVPTVSGSAENTCMDWTSTTGTLGVAGLPWDTGVLEWFSEGSNGLNYHPCNTTFLSIICLQQ